MDEIIKLEKKVFGDAIISKIPFEFFNLIASVVVNPELFNHIEVPDNIEKFFQAYKKDAARDLYQIIIHNGITTKAKSFSEAYISLFIKRYTESFKKNIKYTMRRIQTYEDYGLLEKLHISKQFNEQIYVAFGVEKIIPVLENGEIDFKKLVSDEKKYHRLASYFSYLTSQSLVAKIIWADYLENTSRGLLPRRLFYGSEMEDLINEVTFELLNTFAKIVYKSLSKDMNLNYIIENILNYYVLTTDPDKFKFSPDLEQFEINVTNIILKELDGMKYLTKQTKDAVYYELIHSLLLVIETGMAIPEFYYDLKLREASENDKKQFKIKYALDLYLYDSNGLKGNTVWESYGFTVDEYSLDKILQDSFQNENLYKRFLDLNK